MFCTEVILYKVQKFMTAGLTDTDLYCINLSDLSLSAQLLALAAASVNYLGVLKALVPFSVVSVTTLRLKLFSYRFKNNVSTCFKSG